MLYHSSWYVPYQNSVISVYGMIFVQMQKVFPFENVPEVKKNLCRPTRPALPRTELAFCPYRSNKQQQQHSIFSQASWGRLEMKPQGTKVTVQAR